MYNLYISLVLVALRYHQCKLSWRSVFEGYLLEQDYSLCTSRPSG